MAAITITPDMLASFFGQVTPQSQFFGNQTNPQQPPQAAQPPAQQVTGQGQAPVNPMTGQHTDDTDPFTWKPPAGTPAPTGFGPIANKIIYGDANGAPPTEGSQGAPPAPKPPTPPVDPAMAAAAAKNTTPPAPPVQATLDSFGQAAAASKPQAPSAQPQAPAVAPPTPGNSTGLASILAQNDPSLAQPSAPNVSPTGAVDYGRSTKNIDDASGKNAPIPGRPIVPGTRDINPATGKPFTTDEWNQFKSGVNPDTGRQMTPEETALYAKNNGINLKSFSNNHNTLQNLLGDGLAIAAQIPARTSAYGGRLGPLPGYMQDQIKQGEDFFTNQANDRLAAQQYDQNKGAVQAKANLDRAGAEATAFEHIAQGDASRANANLHNRQADQLGGDPLAVAADGKTPLMGKDYLTYLQQKNPGHAATLQAVMDYREDPTKVSSMRAGERGALFNEINRIDPTFDETKYANRASLKKSFMDGKDNDNLVAINTAVAHLGTANDLAQQLHNGGSQAENTFVNWVKTQFGHPEVNNLQTAQAAVSGELAKTFKSSGATDTEIAKFSKLFDPKESPDQFAGDLQTAQSLMAGRLGSINQTWKKEFGTDYPALLSDQSKAVLAKMPGGQALLSEASGGAPTQGSTPFNTPMTAPATSTPAANAAQPEQPVYVNGKLMGYTTDGKTFSRKVGQ